MLSRPTVFNGSGFVPFCVAGLRSERVISGTYGCSHTPLKSGLPPRVRGAGPVGGTYGAGAGAPDALARAAWASTGIVNRGRMNAKASASAHAAVAMAREDMALGYAFGARFGLPGRIFQRQPADPEPARRFLGVRQWNREVG